MLNNIWKKASRSLYELDDQMDTTMQIDIDILIFQSGRIVEKQQNKQNKKLCPSKSPD